MRKVAPLLILCALLLTLFGCARKQQTTPKQEAEPFATRYRIQAALLPDQNVLSVQTEIDYCCPTDDLSAVKLRLYANAYQEGNDVVTEEKRAAVYPSGIADYGKTELSCVLANGVETSYDLGQNGTLLTLRLPKKCKKGDALSFSISQTITLAKCRHRLGYVNGYFSLSDFYPEICSFREGKFVAYEYTPYGDPFCRETADFAVDLTLPIGYECASSAKEELKERQGDTIRLSYILKGARDFALVCSQKLRCTEMMAGATVVRYYRENDPKTEETLGVVTSALQNYVSFFGTFPYPSYTVVLAPFFEAGVEHSGLSVVSDSLSAGARKTAILHETAHQWWYGKVGNDEFQNPWMDEGLAEYAVAAYYRTIGAENAYKTRIRDAEDAYAIRLALKGAKDTRFDLPLPELSDGYYDRVYCGGLLLFSSLAERFGAEAFHQALKTFADRYDGKTASPVDLINSLSTSLDADLSSFFDAWLSGRVPVQ